MRRNQNVNKNLSELPSRQYGSETYVERVQDLECFCFACDRQKQDIGISFSASGKRDNLGQNFFIFWFSGAPTLIFGNPE